MTVLEIGNFQDLVDAVLIDVSGIFHLLHINFVYYILDSERVGS